MLCHVRSLTLLVLSALRLFVAALAHWEAQRLARGVVSLGHGLGQGANAQYVALTLGDRDGLAGIQQVEGVGGFQNALVGGQGQRFFQCQQVLGFLLVLLKQWNRKSTSACSKL